MKYLLSLAVIAFIGCGGGSGGDSATSTDQNSSTKKPLKVEDVTKPQSTAGKFDVTVQRAPILHALVKDSAGQEAIDNNTSTYTFLHQIAYPITVSQTSITFMDVDGDGKPSIGDVRLGDIELSSCDNNVTPISTYLQKNTQNCANIEEVKQKVADDFNVQKDELSKLPSEQKTQSSIILTNAIYASLNENNTSLENVKKNNDKIKQIVDEKLIQGSKTIENVVIESFGINKIQQVGVNQLNANLKKYFQNNDLSDTNGDISVSAKDKVRYGAINDEWYIGQWAINPILPKAWRGDIDFNANIHPGDYFTKYRGEGVKVAVIDNGLTTDIRDLEGAVVAAYSIERDSENVSHFSGDGGHGTMVTGLIGARANTEDIFGIASLSDIIFVQYATQPDSFKTIKAFKYAADQGAQIISNSWGTFNVDDSVKRYIQELATTGRDGKGIVIVFASGNDGGTFPNDESAIPEVISVGASNHLNKVTAYSNYGEYLDIIAPGGESGGENGSHSIWSLASTYEPHVKGAVGTSFSAPITSGVIALMLEKNPNLKASQIEEILQQTADKIGGVTYDANGHHIRYGYGKLNMKKALDAVVK